MKYSRKFALILADLFFVELSYLISFKLLQGYQLWMGLEKNLLALALIYILVFYVFKLYDSLWNYASVDEFLLAVAANLVAGAIAYIIMMSYYGNGTFTINIIAVIFSMIFTIGIRVLFRLYRRGLTLVNLLEKKKCEKVMIVGAGAAGTMILREMVTSEYMKLNPVALIDDDMYKKGKRIFGVKVQGNRNDIERVAKEKAIDSIIIAMPAVEPKVKAEIIDICKRTGCKLKIAPGLYEILNGNAVISDVRDVEVEDLLGRDTVELDANGIEEYIKDKVILVTGGGGSIGSELCRQIARFKPKSLIIFDIYENNAYDIQNELRNTFKNLDLKVLIGSVRDKKRIERVFKDFKPNIVFHAAAHKHVPLMEDSPSEAIKNNVFGTLNLVEMSSKYEAEKFVMISTDKAVNPTNVMGATKRLCEMIIQAVNERSKTEFVAVRFGNVLGSNGSVIPLFKKQIKSGGPVTVTHKDITRFFMVIPEAAQLVLQAGAYAEGGEIFVLDMGKPVKIYKLAEDLIRLSGYEPNKDMKIEVTGLRPGEKLYEELLMGEEDLRTTGHEKIFVGKPTFKDLDKLKEELESMRFILDNGSDKDIVRKLKEIVPTFKDPKEVNEKEKDYGGIVD